MSIYRGFQIDREEIGRYGGRYQYHCGNFAAPRKLDVKRHIDDVIDREERLELELIHLNRVEVHVPLTANR